jgi:hypothetical protein
VVTEDESPGDFAGDDGLGKSVWEEGKGKEKALKVGREGEGEEDILVKEELKGRSDVESGGIEAWRIWKSG